jgi:hypothetical protein
VNGENMKKFLKNLSWSKRLIISFFVVIALGGFYFYSNGSLPFQKDTVTVKVQETKDGEQVIQLEDTNFSKIEEEIPNDMSEDEVMAVIHQMSHQKVISDKKWGAVPLTHERVNQLIRVIEEHRSDFSNSKVLLDILHRWAKEDFSSVDDDHNQVWNLQGGTVGKAVGISSVDEEREFIEKNFKIKQ